MVTGSDLEQSLQAIELAKQYRGQCYATVGVHPCSADAFERADGGGDQLLEGLKKTAEQGTKDGWVKAFGEFGLDFDRLGHCKEEVQERWFGRQLEVAVEVHMISLRLF